MAKEKGGAMSSVMVYEVCRNSQRVQGFNTRDDIEACYKAHQLCDTLNEVEGTDEYYVSSFERGEYQ